MMRSNRKLTLILLQFLQTTSKNRSGGIQSLFRFPSNIKLQPKSDREQREILKKNQFHLSNVGARNKIKYRVQNKLRGFSVQ